jgi:hypothetical protein
VSTHYFRFDAGAATRQRAPLLERLLARANSAAVAPDWRVDAFRVLAPDAPVPGIGAAALFAERGPMNCAATVFIATPVHYIAEMSDVRLAAQGVLTLEPPESDALAGDFNHVWRGSGIGLHARRDAVLFCIVDAALDVLTRDPEDVLDRYIANYLPSGAGAARLKQLMSEIELWLFEHAVNRARVAHSAPTLSGLWLWGGGRALSSLPQVKGWTGGDDLYFNAFAAGLGTGAAVESDSAVVVIDAEPGTPGWLEAESRWFGRSVGALRAGRIAQIEVSAGDRRFSVSRRDSRRFWRRSRPWWEYFA